jgi:uncharacterized membrane protein (Fun14 family)
MSPLVQRILAPLVGAAAASGDGPWRAKTVLLALLFVLIGSGFWVRDMAKGPPPPAPAYVTTPGDRPASGGGWDFHRPFPAYVRVCASYVGGFFIGWAFRRFIRLGLALAALATLLVGLGKYAGWDAAPAETKVKERAAWVQHEAATASDYMKHLLPSASAGAVGAFLGFRRKDNRQSPNDCA